MNLPDDYGLSIEETLARVGDPARAMLHKTFWSQWWKAVTSDHVLLTPRLDTDPSDPSATHEFLSLRHTRIGCRLLAPTSGPAKAGVIVLHGYDNVPSLEEQAESERALTERGLAVLVMRVRGFAGSRLDTPGLPPAGQLPESGWITHGLDAPEAGLNGAQSWVFPWAAADVVDACRAMRNWLFQHGQSDAHIFLKGRSLGATLAVVAAAQLIGRLPHDPVVERLVIALPTLADWSWRADQPSPRIGTGLEIGRLLDAMPTMRENIIERLRLMDPVIHAASVRCRVLCMLAERDDVAPAPAAAAVYNALASDVGRKWRFVVPYGHIEGGLANARRHALFERCTLDFLDPDQLPRESMLPWEPWLRRGDAGPAPRR